MKERRSLVILAVACLLALIPFNSRSGQAQTPNLLSGFFLTANNSTAGPAQTNFASGISTLYAVANVTQDEVTAQYPIEVDLFDSQGNIMGIYPIPSDTAGPVAVTLNNYIAQGTNPAFPDGGYCGVAATIASNGYSVLSDVPFTIGSASAPDCSAVIAQITNDQGTVGTDQVAATNTVIANCTFYACSPTPTSTTCAFGFFCPTPSPTSCFGFYCATPSPTATCAFGFSCATPSPTVCTFGFYCPTATPVFFFVTATATVNPNFLPPPPPPPSSPSPTASLTPLPTFTPTLTPTPTATFTPSPIPTATPVPLKHFVVILDSSLHPRRFGNLSITVQGTSGRQISGVRVTLNGRAAGLNKLRTGKTNGHGQITFKNLWPPRSGQITVTAVKSGWWHQTVNLAVR